MKKLLAILSLLLLAAVSLFALDGLVTWTWYENDPKVAFYRYQIDGEDDDKWTVVDWSVNEVSAELDISVVHTLFLQQSYDGIYWSASSYVSSEIYQEVEVPAEEVPYEEQTETVEAVGEPVAETVEETVVETVENPVPAAPALYKRQINLDYGVGYMNFIPNSDGPKSLGAFLSYSHTFMKAGVFDLGVKANLAMYTTKNLIFDVEKTQLYGYLNALALVTARVASSDMYLAIGPDVGAGFVTDNGFNYGLAVEMGVRYHRSENFVIGLALSDHYYLAPISDMANRFDVRVFLSKSF